MDIEFSGRDGRYRIDSFGSVDHKLKDGTRKRYLDLHKIPNASDRWEAERLVAEAKKKADEANKRKPGL